MIDVHSPETRSYNMSRIRGKGTKPEEIVRKYLFSKGYRYRKNDNRLPGKPDIVLPKHNVIIFINGCFWHIHKECKYFSWPENNKEFWQKKLIKNFKRDQQKYQALKDMGWRVIIIWTCELKDGKAETTLEQLDNEIKTFSSKHE